MAKSEYPEVETVTLLNMVRETEYCLLHLKTQTGVRRVLKIRAAELREYQSLFSDNTQAKPDSLSKIDALRELGVPESDLKQVEKLQNISDRLENE